MRCKRHTADFSSRVGVCASCLRERLFSLAASTAASENDDNDHHRHSRISPPPLIFPRSVSPYVAPRKSDAGGGDSLASSNSRFFATPQVGSNTDQSYGGGGSSSSEKVFESGRSFKKKRSGLSRFSSFFRTRSEDYDSRTKFSTRDSCDASTFSPSSSSSSRSWLSKVLSVRSKKQSTNTNCYIEDLIASESNHHHQHRPRHRYCRGMSPAGDTAANDYDRESVEESPGRARRTPAMGTPGRRKTATIGIGRSVSGMAFCLSPLVRAKPNCSSNWKGKFPPDFGYSGELKSPAKPHISTAASFCANRSKKLVDLGRVDHRR
ncbi:hypothetical protein EUTSA_v10001551mg [Eutrema salsugineum]|uniref:Uncharacterized protein n=1 Tax=Eutrema salsugineum TaxID=72664 RepID=V4L629_EUTSA|nr:uncharacterized protein LOC18015621 [Eutrema salsugineum]ESQ39094.1 hypothetical protein EUTSA_v10001551mg [Eutrema salsugineum]